MSIRYLKKILLLYIENIIVKKKVPDWRVMQVARAEAFNVAQFVSKLRVRFLTCVFPQF